MKAVSVTSADRYQTFFVGKQTSISLIVRNIANRNDI